MKRTRTAFLVLAGTLSAPLASPALAQITNRVQAPAPQQQPVVTDVRKGPVVVYQNPENFQQVQQELQRILEAYPPSVRQVLQLDPSLMQREDYMATYPALGAFLQQHPEIARNPRFFFGAPYVDRERTERERSLDVLRNTLDGIGFLTGFLVVISLIYSLLRQAVEYRRWRRQIQIQTDVHTKLLDRMTNNQELLAYIETPAGRRFLEAQVPAVAQAAAPTLAPLARILWSIQIGVVVIAAGIGFWVARTSIADVDLVTVFQVMGSLAVAVGVGFVASAILSWGLSQRMGLINLPATKVE